MLGISTCDPLRSFTMILWQWDNTGHTFIDITKCPPFFRKLWAFKATILVWSGWATSANTTSTMPEKEQTTGIKAKTNFQFFSPTLYITKASISNRIELSNCSAFIKMFPESKNLHNLVWIFHFITSTAKFEPEGYNYTPIGFKIDFVQEKLYLLL